MSSDSIDKVLWFAKVFQFLATVILTPEIIGPDRFDRLQKFIESQDFTKKRFIIFLIISCLINVLIGILVEVYATPFLLPTWERSIWYGLSFLVVFLGIFVIISGKMADTLTELILSALIKFVSYLRSVSLFRIVAIIFAVFLLFLGFGLELTY